MNRLQSIGKAVFALVKTLVLLGLAFYFFAFAIATLPKPAGFLALLVVAVVAPIAKWQSLLSRILPRSWIKAVLAVVLMVVTIIAWQPIAEERGVKEPPKPTAEVVVVSPAQATEAPKPTSTPAPTPTPTPVPAREIIDQIYDASAEYLDYFSVKGDEAGIIINMAMDGIAEELALALLSGHDETSEPWATYRETVLNFYFLFEDVIAANGRTDLELMVNLVNDRNYNNYLLSVYRGEIIYDEMAIMSSN